MYDLLDLTDTEAECHRPGAHCGEVFARTSASGLTRAWICEAHATQLEADLARIVERYPEVNHPDGCGCYGCSEGSW